MKKVKRIVSTVLAGLTLLSAVPAVSATEVKVSKPKVTVSNTSKGIKISWKKAKNAKKYVVMRKLSTAKKYNAVKTSNSSKAGSYVDKSAKAGKKYKYTVKAVNGSKSATSSAKTIVRLKAPKLKDYTEKEGYVYFKWDKVSGAKKYEVYYALVKNGKTGKYKLAEKSSYRSYYEFKYENAVIKYKVRAINGKSKSEFSKVLKKDFIDAPDFYVTLASDYSCVELSWDEIDNVDGYRIYRSTQKGKRGELWKDLKNEDCTADDTYGNLFGDDYVSFIEKDTEVEEGVTYYYTIVAYDGKRESFESSDSAKYQSAACVLKVGETNTEIADEYKLIQDMMEEMGYTYSFESEDESILKVDEKFNLIGISEGKTNLICKMTIEEDGMSVKQEIKVPVKVLPADNAETPETPAIQPTEGAIV